jgi:hypothetical protein
MNDFGKEYGCTHHFCFLCIFKLENDVVNSTSLIHVYGHGRVARCMIFKVKFKDKELVRCLMDVVVRVW